jgi:hypothetical protein
MKDARGVYIKVGNWVELRFNQYLGGNCFPAGLSGLIVGERTTVANGDEVEIDIIGQKLWVKAAHVELKKYNRLNQQAVKASSLVQTVPMRDAYGMELFPDDLAALIAAHPGRNNYSIGTVGRIIRQHSNDPNLIRVKFGGKKVWVLPFEIEFKIRLGAGTRPLGASMARLKTSDIPRCLVCRSELQYLQGVDYCSQCRRLLWEIKQGLARNFTTGR